MQSKAKVNSTITHAVVDGKLEFTILGAGKIVFDPNKVSAANRARAMVHGFIQRISDGGAVSRADAEGRIIPAEQLAAARFERMSAITAHLESGSDDWNIRAPAARGVDAGLTIRAMIRAGLAADVDAANGLVDRLATKRDVDRAAALRVWATSDKVAKAIAEIRADDAPTGADDLLAELGDE
jgi:hypothetical protein